MSIRCQNCGQITRTEHCQWCHFPAAAAPRRKGRRILPTLGWVVSGLLAAVIIGVGLVHFLPGYGLYLVRSESMAPTINLGDFIITGPAPAVTPGDIVTFTRGKATITHRVISTEGGLFQTRGDAAEEADPWLVQPADVQGKYLFRIPYLGYALNFFRSKTGWFVGIVLPAAVLVGMLVREIIKEALRPEEATA